jgi:hypothetical protein
MKRRVLQSLNFHFHLVPAYNFYISYKKLPFYNAVAFASVGPVFIFDIFVDSCNVLISRFSDSSTINLQNSKVELQPYLSQKNICFVKSVKINCAELIKFVCEVDLLKKPKCYRALKTSQRWALFGAQNQPP